MWERVKMLFKLSAVGLLYVGKGSDVIKVVCCRIGVCGKGLRCY